jgi:hypothetical protein
MKPQAIRNQDKRDRKQYYKMLAAEILFAAAIVGPMLYFILTVPPLWWL